MGTVLRHNCSVHDTSFNLLVAYNKKRQYKCYTRIFMLIKIRGYLDLMTVFSGSL